MRKLALLLLLFLPAPSVLAAPPWEELALARLGSWLQSSGMVGAHLSLSPMNRGQTPPGSLEVLVQDLARNDLVKALPGLAGGFGGPDPVTRLEFRGVPDSLTAVTLRLQLHRKTPADERASITAGVQLMMRAFKVPGEIRKTACLGAQYSASGESSESLWFEGLDLQLAGAQSASLQLLLPPGLQDLSGCAATLAALEDSCVKLDLQPFEAPTTGPRAGRTGLAVVLTDKCGGSDRKPRPAK
jgi:hypothetical protein